MGKLALQLLAPIRKQGLLCAGDRVAAAVSGGADSVALLLLLLELRAELGVVVSVAHVNHKLRGEESDGDEQFVRELAAKHAVEFFGKTAAVERKAGIESEARRLRYEFFCELLAQGKATKVATAHTLDDQAETVLMRMFRGTGIRGLGGILPRLNLVTNGEASGEVVRPALRIRRVELRAFLQARGQAWREDSSNQDESFFRNRVRGRLLPLITQEFGDASVEHLAELAEIARAEEELWSKSVELPATGQKIDVEGLMALPLASQRRMVRGWIEKNVPSARISFRLIESVLELAKERGRREIDVPAGAHNGELSGNALYESTRGQWKIRTGPGELILEVRGDGPTDYQYALRVPGGIHVPELGTMISAEIAKIESVPENERPSLLDAARAGTELTVRNWRAGDRYWPAHTKQERKIKELLNERHVTGAQKKLWPVVENNGEIVWVMGFPVAEALRARTGSAVWIRGSVCFTTADGGSSGYE